MTRTNNLQEEIQRLCKALRLPSIAGYVEHVTNDTPLEEGLLTLLTLELEERRLRGIAKRIKQAGFPRLKTVDTFEVKRLPHLNQEDIDALMTFDFVKDRRNIIAIGPSGTGKTHLLCAIGLEAIRNGYSVLFKRASQLVTEMIEAKDEKQLSKYLKTIVNQEILIIDEVGYLSLNSEAANLLFQVFAERYEVRSTLITTNLIFSKWVDFLGEPRLVTALIDRLAHKSIFLNMNGGSYRLQSTMEPQKTQ